MNKVIKIALAVMGATNVVFNLFTPIAIALLIINFFSLSGLNSFGLMLAAVISTLFRAIKIGVLNNDGN